MELGPYLRASQARGSRFHQMSQIVVGDRHAFRSPGSARGVDQIRDLISARNRQRRDGLSIDRLIIEINNEELTTIHT